MGIRNNNWDLLPLTVNAMKRELKNQSKVSSFYKAKKAGDIGLEIATKNLTDNFLVIEKLAENINQKFSSLKKDYTDNIINLARYKDALKPLHELMTGENKLDVKALNTSEIVEALKEAGYR